MKVEVDEVVEVLVAGCDSNSLLGLLHSQSGAVQLQLIVETPALANDNYLMGSAA